MPALFSDFLATFGVLGLSAGAVTAFAYWLFKIFGEKWLAQKFNAKLEDYKHAQQKELERLRFQINTTMDRKVKLHQFEFEVLPTLWGHLNGAFGTVASFVSPMQTYPDLDRMNEQHLAEFLSESPLSGWQKEELKGDSEKTRSYMRMIFWHDLNQANAKFQEFNNYFITNSIFLTEELKGKIAQIREILGDALIEKEVEEQHPSPRIGRFEHSRKVRKEGRKLLDEIQTDVRALLWQGEGVAGAAEPPRVASPQKGAE